jgi:hypothetical protein
MLGNLVYNRDPAERRIPLTPILPQFVRRAIHAFFHRHR